jgi:hypothetical protein
LDGKPVNTESKGAFIAELTAGNGSAAWKLSQLGGQDASDALLGARGLL